MVDAPRKPPPQILYVLELARDGRDLETGKLGGQAGAVARSLTIDTCRRGGFLDAMGALTPAGRLAVDRWGRTRG